MKKLLLILACFLVLWIFGTRFFSSPKQIVLIAPSPTPARAFSESVLGLSEHEEALKIVDSGNERYRFSWIQVDDPRSIVVGVNEQLASDSGEIKTQRQCAVLTSGAFYGRNDKPIGLIVSAGKLISPWQVNQLFNGTLGLTAGVLAIREGEQTTMDWAVQGGPILIKAGQPLSLDLKADQQARRIVAGVTQAGKLFLVVVTAKDSLFEGPTLNNLPSIMKQIELVVGTPIDSAMNLDGGRASAYLTDAVSLKELKPIGSYICVK